MWKKADWSPKRMISFQVHLVNIQLEKWWKICDVNAKLGDSNNIKTKIPRKEQYSIYRGRLD